ncbi:hypothetical protein AKJ45_01950 [candidate division MSBL1 archaeon SCGC-AAA261F19]|uniref:Peptidase M48 domain-containing protein n=1 Tax=candidate division MSBL1 archaeon SCGC-AAA261F19 TaxID=1698275 RepID=A0A133VA33_9EURY|nr:hypothetical protein AKJ45_01950 [candidate division MSBL1 archaeon SCGC-AAA261F19]
MDKESEKEAELETYERVFDQIWRQYTFFAEKRERQERKFEITILLVSILSFLLFTLTNPLSQWWSTVSLGCYGLAFVFSFFFIMPRKIWIPWIGKKEFYRKISRPEKISKQLITEVYGFVSHINELVNKRNSYLELIHILILIGSAFPFAIHIVEISPQPFLTGILVLGWACLGIIYFDSMFGSLLTEKPVELDRGSKDYSLEKERKNLLDKLARERGIKVNARFVNEDKLVQMPVLPTFSRRLGGVLNIPRSLNKKYDVEELVAVWFHELNHARFLLTLKVLAYLFAVLSLFLLIWSWPGLNLPLGQTRYVAHLVIRSLIWGVAFFLMWGVPVLILNRKHELSSDGYAAKAVGAKSMIGALEKSSEWKKEVKIQSKKAKIYRLLKKIKLEPHPPNKERIENLRKNFEISD